MLKGFKEFIFRGNVVDLAVGVVMGASFSAVVNALVKDILTPFIGAIAKVPDFSDWSFTINDSKFLIGDFLNVFISFLLAAIAIYFFVMLPINTFLSKVKKEPSKDSPIKKCPECLSDIPSAAKRCSHCTVEI